jgi:uncharacterized RDD family membrane protein YckC
MPLPPRPAGRPAAATAPLGRRLAAWAIDAVIVFCVFVGLSLLTYYRLSDLIGGVGTRLVTFGVWDLVSTQGDVPASAGRTGLHLWDVAVSYVVQGFALLVLAQFGYQFASMAWKGRTVGKAVLDVQVRVRPGDTRARKGQALRRAMLTTAAESGLYSLACIMLVTGRFFLAAALWTLAVALFVLNALPMLLGRGRRTLGDRVSNTVVVRTGLYRDAIGAAVQGAQVTAMGAQAAAAVARDQARRLAAAQPVQQALTSTQAQQARDLGRRAKDAGGRMGGRAKDAGGRMGGRLKGAYEERRAQRLSRPADETPALPQAQPYPPHFHSAVAPPHAAPAMPPPHLAMPPHAAAPMPPSPAPAFPQVPPSAPPGWRPPAPAPRHAAPGTPAPPESPPPTPAPPSATPPVLETSQARPPGDERPAADPPGA